MMKQYNKISENLNLQVNSLNEQLSAMDDIQPKLDQLRKDAMYGRYVKDQARKYKRIVGFSMTMANKANYQVDYIWGLLDDMIQTQWEITGICQSKSYKFVSQQVQPAMERSEQLLDHYDSFISKMNDELSLLDSML